MEKETLAHLKQGETATVAAINGGEALQQRLRSVGVKEGKKLSVVAKHPFTGPFVVEIDKRHISIGRGMASKIIVTPQP